jgi:phospholipase C
VFHVYDRLRLGRIPRRYTVEAGKQLADVWTAPPVVASAVPVKAPPAGAYDLWILGPNGFHRGLRGNGAPPIFVRAMRDGDRIVLELSNGADAPREATLTMLAYADPAPRTIALAANAVESVALPGPWYDAVVRCGDAAWRFAGRIETGYDGTSDPAMTLASIQPW